MINKFRVVETLSNICLKHMWFNNGSIAQYGIMFNLATDQINNEQNETLAETRIATAIWICTADSNGETINYNDILNEITKWFKTMRKWNEPDEDDGSGIGQAFNPD